MKERKEFTLRAAKSLEGHQEPGQRVQLWGRPLGREVRAELEDQLATLAPGETLMVNLDDVEVMDYSFASEVFGRLYGLLAVQYPGRALVLTGLGEDVREALSVTLAAMEMIALEIKNTRAWDILGKAGETDRETLAALRQSKAATAPQLAEALGIKLTAANGRLKNLTEAGMIVRVRVSAPTGGEQYVYHWPV